MSKPPATPAATLIAWLRLPHAVPIVAVLCATAGLAWIVGGAALTAGTLAMMLLAMLGGQIVVGVVNELVDAPIDAMTKPQKPIPAGLVSRRGAAGLGVAGAVLMLAAGLPLGWKSLALLLLGTGIGVAYSLWFKATPLGWLPYVAALPLLPVWVAVTLDAFEPALLTLYLLGIPGTLAIHLAQSLPDVAADRAAGIETLAVRLGEGAAWRVCWGAVLACYALAAGVAAVGPVERRWLLAAGAIGFGAWLIDWTLWRRDRRAGVMAAFPCVILALGPLALAWTAGVTD
jgi:4-hydroxybenzoate polyprenyltransferase